jgi:opacity protein-like surface antigen
MQKVILFLLLATITLSVKAQFSVGVRQGYGAHGVYLEPAYIEKYQEPFYKPNTGLVVIFNNTNNTGLQMELNYAQKGWQEEDSTVANSMFSKTINYLEIPFFSHFEIGYGKVRPIIFAGPYLAFKLSETTDSSNFSHIWYEDSPYTQYDQEIKTIDFGIKLGLGLRYNITPRFGIYIDARYDLEIAGGRDIFIDRPDDMQASRLKEISGTFGILWHILPQKEKEEKKGYTPKEDLFEEY